MSAKEALPGEGLSVPDVERAACLGVRILVDEMHGIASGGRPRPGTGRRRSLCHLRQIAMYVCHVVLQMSLTDIGLAFGRDRTTVGHACKVIEDRRDDQAYDAFVCSIERVAAAFLARPSEARHGTH